MPKVSTCSSPNLQKSSFKWPETSQEACQQLTTADWLCNEKWTKRHSCNLKTFFLNVHDFPLHNCIKTWLSTCQRSWKGLANRSSSHAMLFSTSPLNDSGWGREWKSCVISRSLNADEQQLENCNQTEWIGMGRSGTLNLAKRQLWNWICLLVVSMCLLLRPGKSFLLLLIALVHAHIPEPELLGKLYTVV